MQASSSSSSSYKSSFNETLLSNRVAEPTTSVTAIRPNTDAIMQERLKELRMQSEKLRLYVKDNLEPNKKFKYLRRTVFDIYNTRKENPNLVMKPSGIGIPFIGVHTTAEIKLTESYEMLQKYPGYVMTKDEYNKMQDHFICVPTGVDIRIDEELAFGHSKGSIGDNQKQYVLVGDPMRVGPNLMSNYGSESTVKLNAQITFYNGDASDYGIDTTDYIKKKKAEQADERDAKRKNNQSYGFRPNVAKVYTDSELDDIDMNQPVRSYKQYRADVAEYKGELDKNEMIEHNDEYNKKWVILDTAIQITATGLENEVIPIGTELFVSYGDSEYFDRNNEIKKCAYCCTVVKSYTGMIRCIHPECKNQNRYHPQCVVNPNGWTCPSHDPLWVKWWKLGKHMPMGNPDIVRPSPSPIDRVIEQALVCQDHFIECGVLPFNINSQLFWIEVSIPKLTNRQILDQLIHLFTTSGETCQPVGISTSPETSQRRILFASLNIERVWRGTRYYTLEELLHSENTQLFEVKEPNYIKLDRA